METNIQDQLALKDPDGNRLVDCLLLGLSIGCIFFASGLLLIQFFAVCYARYHFHRSKHQEIAKAPGVTILKPLRFTDQDIRYLESNLESFFTLSYQKYEIIFCVREYDDSSIPVVQRLIKKYPSISAKLLIGGNDIGINPKINNMQKGYENAKYSFVWICDAGIRIHPDTLTEMMCRMLESETIALVHQLPFVTTALQQNMGSFLEKIYFGTQHARIQITAHCLNQVCITGMSNLIRREALDDACGGLIGLSSYIAEDYFMTIKMHEAGWTFRLSSFPALQNLIDPTVGGFFRRMVRWSRLRIKMLPGITIIEPFSECFISGFLFAIGVGYFTESSSSWAVFLIYGSWWMLMDFILLSGLQGAGRRLPLHKFIPLWALRESSTIPILLTALLRPNVTWQGNSKYRVRLGGKAERIQPCPDDDLQ